MWLGMSLWNIGSTTKNDKSEMRQIMWDGPKWKTGTDGVFSNY